MLSVFVIMLCIIGSSSVKCSGLTIRDRDNAFLLRLSILVIIVRRYLFSSSKKA
jgi:hypothetical protein